MTPALVTPQPSSRINTQGAGYEDNFLIGDATKARLLGASLKRPFLAESKSDIEMQRRA